MKKLYIDEKIEIEAPDRKVWEVLTRRQYTNEWAKGFDPGIYVDSSWEMDAPVLWKDKENDVVVEGKVIALDPRKMLRFTTFDVQMGRGGASEEDGILFELRGHAGSTTLRVRHGDFAAMPERAEVLCYDRRIMESYFAKNKKACRVSIIYLEKSYAHAKNNTVSLV